MYPLVESTHVLSIMLFAGLTWVMDLRLLGVTLKTVPMSDVLDRVLPWIKVGLVLSVVTGVLLFYAIPVRNYQNIFFRIKVIMLVLAGLNAWVFRYTVERRVPDWDLDPIAPRGARVAGALSLILWACIIVAGRMIAYNWFDCDIQPQSDFINWAAGCIVPPH
jgi:hypothetical protein